MGRSTGAIRKRPANEERVRLQADASKLLPRAHRHGDIDETRLVLKREERDPSARVRALSMGDDSGDVDDASGQVLTQLAGPEGASGQRFAHVAERVLPRGQTRRGDIRLHAFRLR